MKTYFISLLFFSFNIGLSTVQADGCTIAKVKVEGVGGEKAGTGFAVSTHQLLINEHTLFQNSPLVKIEESPGSNPRLAKVVARDFHSDLALLEVVGAAFQVCKIESSPVLKLLQQVTIIGRDKDSEDRTVIPGRVIDLSSGKLMVPGVPKSLEIQGENNQDLPVRESLSGSAVIVGDSIVGMLSQKSFEGSALAIPSAVLQDFLKKFYRKESFVRSYNYDQEKNLFSFFGLTVSAIDQPSESVEAGNPHNGRAQVPPSMKDIYGKGDTAAISALTKDSFVVARVSDLQLLAQKQPDLARVVKAAGAKTVLIRSVEAIETPNVLSLLRVLGSCNSCLIDQFYIVPSDRDRTMDQSLEALVSAISQLRLSIQPTKDSMEVVQALDVLNQLVISMLKDERIFQAYSTKKMDSLKTQWKILVDQLARLELSEKQDLFIAEIMQRLP